MKDTKNTVTEDFALLEKGKDYNRQISLYDKVAKSERFYRGDQWNGVVTNGLPTPVFNIFKRVTNYFVSTIMSEKLSLHYSAEGISCLYDSEMKKKVDEVVELLTSFVNYRIEKDKIDTLLTKGLLDAALSGDMFLYVYWDPEKKSAQGFTGDFATMLVDNTNVFFGDVNKASIDDQPYIILSGRDLVENLKKEAAENGAKREDIEKIVSDSETDDQSGDFGKREIEGTKTNFVIKLFKKNGTVHFRKSTKGCVIIPERDTRLNMYPISMMNWERVKNSYHGEAIATSLTENQLYVNKAFAMVMKHMMDLSFSKVMYNANLIDEWTNEIGEAIAVNGPCENAAIKLEGGSMQTGFLEVINMTIAITKDLMGATDAALGNVDPKNTSAIIALQKSSSQPLELQRKALFEAVERLGMIWLDFIFNYYDSSRFLLYRINGEIKGGTVPISDMKDIFFACTAEVGASAYWSEIATINTLDNLLSEGHITFSQYLERLPEGYITKKKELLDQVNSAKAEQDDITDETHP